MDQDTAKILEAITQRSQSELIYFFIIMLIGLVVVMVPLYALIMKNNRAKETAAAKAEATSEAAEKERLEMYIKREQQLIQVVSTNTEALVSLKTTQEITLTNLKGAVDSGNKSTDKSLDRVHTRLDEILKQNLLLMSNLEKSLTLLERIILNQQTLKDIGGNVLLIVDSLPHDSNFGKDGMQYKPNTEYRKETNNGAEANN